jgi:hypothetical protein
MQYLYIAILASTIALTSTSTQAQEVPRSAKQLMGDQIPEFLHGKKFNVKIVDADAPITATTNWNWNTKKVKGTFDYKGQKGNFENDWVVKDGTSCAEKTPEGKWVCQKIFVDGNTMYEVNAKGKLHAISEPSS